MRHGAHIMAVIDVIEEYQLLRTEGKRVPADALLSQYFRSRRP